MQNKKGALMANPTITLTTDFGHASPYVAALKGVILGINPNARLVDLSHAIPPQDLRHAAYFLEQAIPYFPPGVLHVIVVDPGVGSERALLYVEVRSQRLLVPDNGCWTGLVRGTNPAVRRLTTARYWRQPVSATFHGRDILAPVAGHLSLGVPADALGPSVSSWVRLEEPALVRTAADVTGAVVFVDDFGNLITNIPATELPEGALRVTVGPHGVSRRVRAYAEAAPGQPVALVSSSGLLEIAVPQGNAARQLGVGVGTTVRVSR
jgi:S-adenosylmethionine hydrolase